MSTPAIIMMIVAMLVIWGGLLVAMLNLTRNDRAEFNVEDIHRDL
ncbi:MAG: methionine/alanine import family NSS transporter small subunit [Dermatophilaceae bacterium]